ncbi:4'-phosphopantetheinyl transferase [Labrenzia sp. PHM005]|uniref:4'-phosphopantetheinyl transferase family protein n=1 Tax=Labrenzia sp. PHM005 TaxID=2590016 RepID=UPI0011408AFA|nr:4'-phosphopantetheinyl transferase superfamily protein [Labrenzia sp. PHM005]QDG74826.1 4'-phosphopantetheinyl transferase superfamily protein [Labrenzia sp. PHM005]
MLWNLFPSEVKIAVGDPRARKPTGYPDEETHVANAVTSRRSEFFAGRECARKAMRDLGFQPTAIGVRPDRSPIWPNGLIGTISHSRTLCLAAVALQNDDALSIGLDIEPDSPLPEDMWDTICTSNERSWLAGLPSDQRTRQALRMFTAKESAYKAQYPLTQEFLEFEDLEIAFYGHDFSAVFQRSVPSFAKGTKLRGRQVIYHGHVVSAVCVGSDQFNKGAVS